MEEEACSTRVWELQGVSLDDNKVKAPATSMEKVMILIELDPMREFGDSSIMTSAANFAC